MDEERARLETRVRQDPSETNLRAFWQHLHRLGLAGEDFGTELPELRGSLVKEWTQHLVLWPRPLRPEGAEGEARLHRDVFLSLPELEARLVFTARPPPPSELGRRDGPEALEGPLGDWRHEAVVSLVEFLEDRAGSLERHDRAAEADFMEWWEGRG